MHEASVAFTPPRAPQTARARPNQPAAVAGAACAPCPRSGRRTVRQGRLAKLPGPGEVREEWLKLLLGPQACSVA